MIWLIKSLSVLPAVQTMVNLSTGMHCIWFFVRESHLHCGSLEELPAGNTSLLTKFHRHGRHTIEGLLLIVYAYN